MKTDDNNKGLNRRDFLSSATAVSVAASLGSSAVAAAAAGPKPAAPSESELAMEFDDPAGYSATEI